jgi:hypothetical protein
MTDAFDPERCPGCPASRENARRGRQMEERQERQDGFLLEVRHALAEVQKAQVEGRRESRDALERLEGIMREVLGAVRPAVEATKVQQVPA